MAALAMVLAMLMLARSSVTAGKASTLVEVTKRASSSVVGVMVIVLLGAIGGEGRGVSILSGSGGRALCFA